MNSWSFLVQGNKRLRFSYFCVFLLFCFQLLLLACFLLSECSHIFFLYIFFLLGSIFFFCALILIYNISVSHHSVSQAAGMELKRKQPVNQIIIETLSQWSIHINILHVILFIFYSNRSLSRLYLIRWLAWWKWNISQYAKSISFIFGSRNEHREMS